MKAKASEESDGRLDRIHERLMRRSKFAIGYRMCIWTNFFNVQLLSGLESKFGILRDEFNILLCLADAGAMTGTEVCRIVGRPRNSISRCADRLIKRKLIGASGTEGDRRQTLFEILPKGREIYKLMLPLFVAQEEQMLSALSSEERHSLERILAKLLSSYGQWDPAGRNDADGSPRSSTGLGLNP
jgi:DNA-binding MarR family transcriptional regulator